MLSLQRIIITEHMMNHSRRTFLETAALAVAAAGSRPIRALAQDRSNTPATSRVDTDVLRIGYEASGPASGFPIILLHGFPDDVHAYDGVVPLLVRAGYRAIVPYLRGYGATRFRDPATPRMAEQAAIGQDVIDLADALKLPRFAVAGYDWGGRAAAIAAALHPDRVRATVLIGGYSIQNTLATPRPGSAEGEYRAWYQWYFNTERGRAGLEANRRDLCRLLWKLWSPTWHFTDEEYARTAASFDNPDFVDVVIHSYRHRNGNAPGDPRFRETEARLAQRPPIEAPSITLYGAEDGVAPPARESNPAEQSAFRALRARRVIDGVGHFMPRERPDVVASALIELLSDAR
jgi:pimeloyl-ACP methyl ester carboxylesterase